MSHNFEIPFRWWVIPLQPSLMYPQIHYAIRWFINLKFVRTPAETRKFENTTWWKLTFRLIFAVIAIQVSHITLTAKIHLLDTQMTVVKARTAKKLDFFVPAQISRYRSSKSPQMFTKNHWNDQIFWNLKLYLLCLEMSKYPDPTPTSQYSVSPA